MILKQYSSLRHSFSLYSYAKIKRLPISQEHTQANALSTIDQKLSDYLFFKYDVNQQIEQEFKELRNSTQLLIKKTHPDIISRMRDILFEMPLEVIAQQNLKIIKDVVTILKDKKASQQTQDIYNEVDSRIAAMENKNQNFNSLIRFYRISDQDSLDVRNKRAQIILTNIKQNSQVKLLIEQISFFFQDICSVSILTSLQQQIRFILLKKIRTAIPEISIKLLSKLGRHLNSLSHYDFLPQEIEIVQQIFNRMAQREQEITDQMVEQVFEDNQNTHNSISLSQFYLKVLLSKMQKVKKYNSLQSHLLFHLIELAGSKILPALQYKPSQKLKYQTFIIRYAQANLKTLKHFQKVFRALLVLVKDNCISLQLLQKMRPFIEQCNIKPSLILLHQLSNFVSFRTYIKENIQEATSAKRLSFLSDIIPVLIDDKPTQKRRLWIQFTKKHLSSLQKFIQLIETMLKHSIAIDFQQFEAVIKNNIIFLIGKIQMTSLSNQERISILNYFINTYYHQSPANDTVKQCLMKVPSNLIEDILVTRLKDPTNQQIENYMLIAQLLFKKLGSEKLLMRLLQRVNVRFRQNSLNFAMKVRFKELILIVIDRMDFFLAKQTTVQAQYFDLIRQLLVHYNDNNNQYRLTGFYIKIIQKLVDKISKFDDNLSVKQLIIKQGLKYSLFSHKNIQSIGKIDESSFTFSQREKLKYFRNPKHLTIIDKIDHQTLPLIVLNRNLHHYLEFGRTAISNSVGNRIFPFGLNNISSSQILAQSNLNQFQQILRSISYYTLPVSQIFFQFLLKIIKQLSNKIKFGFIQRYLFFNDFSNKFFIFQELQKILLSWMVYYTQNYQKIEDFQTHVAVLKLLKSIKLQLECIDSKEQQEGKQRQGYKQKNQSNPLPFRYVSLLLQQYNEYPQKNEELLYHLLFTNFHFSNKQERKNLLKFLNAKQGKVLVTAFLYLQPYYNEQQRLFLLKKVINCAKQELANKGKIDFITLQQYYYLKKVYEKQTQNLNIPEQCLDKTPFSKPNQQAFEFLKSIAAFQRCDLIKVKLEENQFYKMKHKTKIHYILFPSFDKQSSYHQFFYLVRLVKKLYLEDALVSFVMKYDNGNFLDAEKIFKGWQILNPDQFKAFRQWRSRNEKPEYEVKVFEEDYSPPPKITRFNSRFISQLRHKKAIKSKK